MAKQYRKLRAKWTVDEPTYMDDIFDFYYIFSDSNGKQFRYTNISVLKTRYPNNLPLTLWIQHTRGYGI
jgi:hypothetical protein